VGDPQRERGAQHGRGVDSVTDELRIRFHVPSRWMTFALDEATAAEEVDREVAGLIGRHPPLGVHQRLLIELLGHKSAGAREDGAAFGAMRYEIHPGHGGSVASMIGWLVGRSPVRTPDEEVADNLARFTVQTRIDQFPPQVSRVRLPYGHGVRVLAARRIPTREGAESHHRALFHTLEYHVPLDRPPASLLFVRFMTSDLVHVTELSGEFEGIIAELRLVPRG